MTQNPGLAPMTKSLPAPATGYEDQEEPKRPS